MKEYGISWDYEETDISYYHIYPYDLPADGIISSLTIDAPLTPENTEDVKAIILILGRIAERVMLHSKNEHSKQGD